MSGGKEIPLSSGRSVFVPPHLLRIVEHPELTRLNRLNQLSLLPSSFCGATHSRFEHYIDVFRLAQSAARRMLDLPECRYVFDEGDIDVLLVGAVLHDINHLPLTHLYQESGLPLLEEIDLFSLALESEHVGPEPLLDSVLKAVPSLDRERLIRVVSGRWEEQSGSRKAADQIISSLLNSGADLDKLSYLVLDSARSGLGFASGLSQGSVLAAIRVVEWSKRDDAGSTIGDGWHLAFDESALPLIEAIVTARTRAFESLYWCDDNRAMMALFLAAARTINNVAGGPEALKALMLASRGETDHAVLQGIDRLCARFEVPGRNLASLFDSIGGTRPRSIHTSSAHYGKLSKLNPSEREDFEARLRTALSAKLPGLTESDSQLMLDVPDRPLDMGGDIRLYATERG